MRRYTQKMLRDMVREGVAVDVTRAGDLKAIPEPAPRARGGDPKRRIWWCEERNCSPRTRG